MKIIFTIIFWGLAAFIAINDWAKENIDNTVIGLMMIGFIPYILEYLVEIEMFGVKAKFLSVSEKKSLEKYKNIEEENNVMKNEIMNNINIQSQNSMTAKLILVRVDLEKEIKRIAEKHNILKDNKYVAPRNLIKELVDIKVVEKQDCNLYLDLLPTLNKVVHGEKINKVYEDVDYILNLSSTLIAKLRKIK